jgi:monofunctional biosynthetic peptidoglycan transglycosylase
MKLFRTLARFTGWLLLAVLLLQLYFVVRVGMMRWVDPQSTAFERSEAYRVAREAPKWAWRQEWKPYAAISDHLKRAVIASEDDGFAYHDGVDWDAIESAWQKNAKAEAAAEKRVAQSGKGAKPATTKKAKVVGGSTITQQLAKNLFLSGERNLPRKAQELAITYMLELFLSKQRILEIYLNSVEWGEGVFGAEAAARRYFGKGAAQLSAVEAARLAVMLPRPKYFEKLQQSAYLADRSLVIVGRMPNAELP